VAVELLGTEYPASPCTLAALRAPLSDLARKHSLRILQVLNEQQKYMPWQNLPPPKLNK
jgi:hypothetical protein